MSLPESRALVAQGLAGCKCEVLYTKGEVLYTLSARFCIPCLWITQSGKKRAIVYLKSCFFQKNWRQATEAERQRE